MASDCLKSASALGRQVRRQVGRYCAFVTVCQIETWVILPSFSFVNGSLSKYQMYLSLFGQFYSHYLALFINIWAKPVLCFVYFRYFHNTMTNTWLDDPYICFKMFYNSFKFYESFPYVGRAFQLWQFGLVSMQQCGGGELSHDLTIA